MMRTSKIPLWKDGNIRVFSRHPSHDVLRNYLKVEHPTCVRLGSVSKPDLQGIVINSVESIKNSKNKLKMKNIFADGDIASPEFYTVEELNNLNLENLKYPILAKKKYRSRGDGMKKLDSVADLKNFLNNIPNLNRNEYYFERYYNYTKEYRLHVSSLGTCFYTCRKMLKSDTPQADRYFRNDSNSVWVLENNPNFDRPDNWKEIEEECVRALNIIGLDIGALDVRVSKKGKFQIIEINSAPSFGNITTYRYMEVIDRLYHKKVKEIICVD